MQNMRPVELFYVEFPGILILFLEGERGGEGGGAFTSSSSMRLINVRLRS